MTTLATRARATTGDALLVTRRRTRQDAGLLLGTAVLLIATLLALLAVPRLLDRTAVTALRTAVVNAGLDGAVTVRAVPQGLGGLPFAAPLEAAGWVDTVTQGLRPAIALVKSVPYTATIGGTDLSARLFLMDAPGRRSEPVTWPVGRAPELIVLPDPKDPDPPPVPDLEVGLSLPVARVLGVDPAAGPVSVELRNRSSVQEVWVTGLYEPVDPADDRWAIAPDLLQVVPADPADEVAGSFSLYVPPAAASDLARFIGSKQLTGEAIAFADSERLRTEDVPALRRAVVTLMAQDPDVTSTLPDVLDAYEAHARATTAQASLVLAGIGATAACCLVLAAALLVERRRSHLAGERARGASLASVALRGAVESVPVACVAALLAGVAITVWLPGQRGSTWLPAALVVVAASAPAILAARAAAAAWTGRRVPADRRERARLAGLRGARRLVAEIVTVAVAVLALVSLRGRGLVPDDGAEPDPLLVATPFLLAVAASLLVVRIAPAVVRAAGRWAARSRGLAAPLAATRAQRGATALLPLVSVTVAVALMVLSGIVVHNVQEGQQVAADRLVGADVRIDGADGILSSQSAVAALEQIASADGVTAVATAAQIEERIFGSGGGLTAAVLVVDAAELARVRDAMGLPVDPGLAALAEPSGAQVPALVDAELLARVDAEDGVPLQVIKGRVDLDVRGTTSLSIDAGAPPADARATHASRTEDDGVVVVDAGALAARTDKPPSTTRAWVTGPRAQQAVADSGIARLPKVTVTTRDDWYETWSHAPLPRALAVLLVAAVGALGVLAVIGLALVVVATSGERGRTLSTLRTLGLDARTARWATLGELAPLVVGGLVGGSAIGLALPVLVGDALGLSWVTAAPGHVPIELTWWPVLVAAGALAVALLVAVLVEQAVRRRERLGEVLRVGAR
ncbi:MAG: hypothetical protein IR158_14285 [Cellulomonas sp.]|uniref:FtsX-like permease family protein n=1 Tax=Cellulomonas sp. TaxID=40001 RepID=UPI0019D9BA70|nr:FtsX-like permease family protein [Cellulomonas sp.]MBF0688921.1 hypothetical protein [Cellulomonas sp.]